MRARGFALAAAVFVVDQLVKYWVMFGLHLQSQRSVPVLPFFSFTWVENRGVSMGLFQADGEAGQWLLIALTAGIAAVVGWWLWRERKPVEALAFALVLGGALGNIVDRVRFGYVVDFAHLHVGGWSFYVFNVADAAISVGVAILLARALLAPKESVT